MNIRHYISFFIKNVIKMLTLLIGVSIAAFMLVSLSPIDPVQANVGATAYMRMTPEKRAQMESYWGKDVPPAERYLNWAKDFVRGDMGTSLKYNRPVAEVVAEKFGTSFAVMCVAWVLSGILGLVLGIVAGYFKDRLPDRLIRGYALLLASTPAFWIGLLLLMIFAVWLGWLPFGMNLPAGMTAAEAGIGVRIRHLLLPALTLGLTGVANITLHTREKMIAIMESDYVLFARARGESSGYIVKRHALRNLVRFLSRHPRQCSNLVLPAITLQFGSISEIFGGSVLVEQVFSYPGLGQAAIDAGLGSDVSLLLAITVISTLFVFLGNLVANVLYGVIDPQIRRGRSHG